MNTKSKIQEELNRLKGIKNTFIIEGNVNDMSSYYTDEGNVQFLKMYEIIDREFDSGATKGFYDILHYDYNDGFTNPMQRDKKKIIEVIRFHKNETDKRQKELQDLNCENNSNKGSDATPNHGGIKMVRDSEIIRTSMISPLREENGEMRMVLNIVNYASHFTTSPDKPNVNETAFFSNLLDASINATRGKFINTLVLIVNKQNDVPAWFYHNNPNVKIISVPNPDRNARKAYVNENYKLFDHCTSDEVNDAKSDFISKTEGLKLVELDELRRLIIKGNKSVEDLSDTVSQYKYGYDDDKWTQIRSELTDEKIRTALRKRVKGQDEAIEHVITIIKRAVTGLSGLQHSSDNKPRGIAFFSGPTGTGKTETAKAIAELLFKDEKALVRLDMSEYSDEHSSARLFGAPPGYVGYDSGGYLTNAVKSNPFCVLLFDEIEKAHPSIMDKFLQILEDGRMTDGQGNTVYFSETLIIFTSNVGISREVYDPTSGRAIGRESIVTPDEPYDVIKSKIEEAMITFFKPEVLNRIGENIIVFDYLKQNNSEEIARSQVNKINEKLLKKNGIHSTLDDSAYSLLFAKSWSEKARKNGGRGIGNVVEAQYLNNLSEFIFDFNCDKNDVISVSAEDNHFVFERGQSHD